MKHAIAFLVIALFAGVGGSTTPALSPEQTSALTTIDEVPTQSQLGSAFGSNAPTQIASVAGDPSSLPAIRLRAIRSIAALCEPPLTCDPSAHAALTSIISDPTYTTATAGSNVLILRAAIESIGQLKDPNDAPNLTDFLDHNSRDVRATTAFALRDLCNTQPTVVSKLRTRLEHESVPQVQLAISAALRALSQSPCI